LQLYIHQFRLASVSESASLFVYLLLPIDVILNFAPVLEYAGDATIVVLVRSMCQHVPLERQRRNGFGR
jgi:uncharacterized membrane protein YkvA (DUF1232 family)